jgi:hypothetical protein
MSHTVSLCIKSRNLLTSINFYYWEIVLSVCIYVRAMFRKRSSKILHLFLFFTWNNIVHNCCMFMSVVCIVKMLYFVSFNCGFVLKAFM